MGVYTASSCHSHPNPIIDLLLPNLLPPIQNLVYNPPLQRLLRPHEEIPLHHPLNLLQALLNRQMPLINLIELLPHPQNLFRMNRNIRRLSAIPPRNLMHHNPRVRQHVPLPGSASAQQQTPHAGGLAEADCGDRGADVLHCVVDGEARGDAAAGGVYVEGDGFGGVVGFEEEELGDDGGGEDFFDFAVEADDALFEQAGEDVRGVVAAVDGFGYEGHGEGGGGRLVLLC
jgi:hypothetical protein